MGDRCSVEIEMPAEYVNKFFEVACDRFGATSDRVTVNSSGSLVWLRYYEVNYGGTDDLDAAAEAGIPFCAVQGAGSDYGCSMTVSNGEGHRIEVFTLHNSSTPFVPVVIEGDTCRIEFEDFLHIQHFAKELYKAKQTWMR